MALPNPKVRKMALGKVSPVSTQAGRKRMAEVGRSKAEMVGEGPTIKEKEWKVRLVGSRGSLVEGVE